MMTKHEAIKAYRRVKEWERRVTRGLIEDIRRRSGGAGPHEIHNWGMNRREPYYSLSREYRHRQDRIWSETRRLSSAFASRF